MAVMAENLGFIKTGQGVSSSIPTRAHIFVEIDHEIISTTIIFPMSDSRKVAIICARTA